jgi:CheY-like chemotaxis protein
MPMWNRFPEWADRGGEPGQVGGVFPQECRELTLDGSKARSGPLFGPWPCMIGLDHAEKPVSPAVLLVDDNRDLLWLMGNFLERNGFRVHARHHAPSLDEVDALAPVVVFLDVEIGDRNGTETCADIKGHPGLENTPVVLVSSHSEDQLRQEAAACRADGWLAKPVEPGTLIRIARGYAQGERPEWPLTGTRR